MAHTCNLISLGGGDWENHSSRSTLGKKLLRPISINKLSMLLNTYNPSYNGGWQSAICHW
jgi:hypothetical protein